MHKIMTQEINYTNLRFEEPFFQMSRASRFLARLVVYSSYAVLASAGLIFFCSDIGQLFWAGVLIFLFLGDRLIRLGEAEKSLVGLTRSFPRLSRRKDHEVVLPENINAARFLSPSSFRILESAYDKTSAIGGSFYLQTLKLLIQHSEIKNGLLRMDVDSEKMEQHIEEILKKSGAVKNSKEELLLKLELIVKKAFFAAITHNSRFIEPADLFSVLGEIDDSWVSKIFVFFEINPADLERAMIFSRFRWSFWRKFPKNLGGFAQYPKRIRHRVMNRAWTARQTPALDSCGIDFTDMASASKAGFLIGHKQEYNRLIDVLSRSVKPNALLIGEPGSGKEAIVLALAYGINKDEVPEALFDRRLVSLQLGSLISGASPAEISSRLNKIIEEIISSGNIIIYIPDIHNLVKTSGGNSMNAADILMPIINNDAFPIIGATCPKEFKQLIEPLSDFANAFENIRIEEVGEDDAVEILIYDSLILEKQYKTTISFGAIKTAVELSHKYFRQKLLPSSAQDLLRETLSSVNLRKDKLIQADDVISIVERKINIPVRAAGKKETEKLLNLEEIIHQSLIDQEQAVSVVARALREYRSGLSRKGGPIAAFLFVGPTGVGKTELSKILATIQFGSESAMVRFDMSEFQTKESITRFIGTPDGKISGGLTDAVMQKPFSLILLDEFEKAHSDILNLFLQVFDDGRLTDGLGRTVDFSNTIIIATSNAHSNFIKERIEAGDKIEKISEDLKKKLTEYFKPELLNRFSQIVAFKNLSLENIRAVTKLQLKSLAKNLEEQGIGFSCDEETVHKIAGLGYDPVFGARPLRAVISEKLRSVLAEKILKGEITKGDAIRVVLSGGEFKFLKA
jgi:ATP-dependent Clp protease ATP-binding subunit ClpC